MAYPYQPHAEGVFINFKELTPGFDIEQYNSQDESTKDIEHTIEALEDSLSLLRSIPSNRKIGTRKNAQVWFTARLEAITSEENFAGRQGIYNRKVMVEAATSAGLDPAY